MNYFLIALFLIPLIWRITTNFKQGIYWAVFLMTTLTSYLVIETGAALPNFTIHRLILITITIAAIKKNRALHKIGSARFLGVLLIYAIVNVLPMIFSIDIVMSVKTYLSFTVETIMFYMIVSSSIESPPGSARDNQGWRLRPHHGSGPCDYRTLYGFQSG